MPDEQDGSLYYIYFYKHWDVHNDLKQISRFFILKFFGFKDFYLKEDGGLLHIENHRCSNE